MINTEQERAHALAEKHGATSYRNRADTSNPAFGFTLGQLEALISEVEQAARRAQVVKGNHVTFQAQGGETAPVQMPEPLARIEGGRLKWHIPDAGYSLPVHNLKGTHNLYNEQQVRQLLAAHGIGKDKA